MAFQKTGLGKSLGMVDQPKNPPKEDKSASTNNDGKVDQKTQAQPKDR
jgi:hypothetical protein